ncbi:RNA polymerase sigma factor [Cryomorpha ignava]|uniref:RNA polymerase sigma factor n=2 Tax=Cryomorpha ignava TaxID=101383 RepID=A0A7K3WNE1_9FLAO|nr:RNA polymerase sigma factor [Cryomorpha ignava]
MYSLAYRITGNFEDAEDVLQEGFLKVFRSIESFRGDSKAGTWIHTIMARTALDRVKSKMQFTDLEIVPEVADESNYLSVESEYLEKAILGLPDGYRSIFTLFEIEGFKHREIADMLAISENTSKSQLHKAKRMLQNKLKTEM